MLRTQFVALALTATVLVTSGCGSSKTDSKTAATATSSTAITPVRLAAGKPLTRAQLIAQADAICATTIAKLAAISPRTTPEVVRSLPQAAIYLGSEAEGLSRLVPPASMVHDWTRIVNDIHFAGEYVTVVSQYFKENRKKAAGPLYAKANHLNTQSKEIAKRDGFKRCSHFRLNE